MNLSNEQKLFLNDLRSQTSDSHETLEANAASIALLDKQVSIAQYQYYLLALYAFVKASEVNIYPLVARIFNDLEQRSKSHLIYNDLVATGFPENAIKATGIACLEPVEIPEALGIMYVLEGSTLGGRILYKHVHETLGLDHNSGASYFAGYGPQTGAMWSSFISNISQKAVSGMFGQRIIDSANQTFRMIDNSMTTVNSPDYDKN